MTPRDILARVRAHLLAQGRRSLLDDGHGATMCGYRSPRGLRCAVGCLIEDHAYDRKTEGRGVSAMLVGPDGRWTVHGSDGDSDCSGGADAALARALNASGVPATHTVRELLVRLQRAHDHHDPDLWERKLDELGTWLDACHEPREDPGTSCQNECRSTSPRSTKLA